MCATCKKKQDWDKEVQYIQWLNEHEAELNKYCGQWITIKLDVGIVSASNNLQEAEKEFYKKYPHEIPHIYHVPRKDEGSYILLWI